MKKVLVLLSLYNGKEFIKEQIDSVFAQSDVEVKILVRDDGSTDDGALLVEKINDDRIEVIRKENVGCAKSFINLVFEAAPYKDFDYYAFCDQDDVWLADKLHVATELLDKYPNESPALYMNQYQMVDRDLNPIPTKHIKARLNLHSAMVNNIATGCTMVFNRTLLENLVQYYPQNITMHDYWVYLVALVLGGNVIYDDNAHILYRQHGRNVIGGKGDGFYTRWKIRANKIFKASPHFYSNMARELLTGYEKDMCDENRSFLCKLTNLNKWKNRIRLLFDNEMLGSTIDFTVRCKLLILTGKY